MGMYAYNPSTWEAEQEDFEMEACLGYLHRTSCLTKPNPIQTKAK
jgi:hypothetical protein